MGMEISRRVGQQIRHYRQASGLTLEQLARLIHKGKSTLSKYENGEISLDVETLGELAEALHVSVNHLLRQEGSARPEPEPGAFSHREYLYFFDGRVKRISRSVLEHYHTDREDRMGAVLFYDLTTLQDPGRCRSLYTGHMTRYTFIYNYAFQCQRSPAEQVFLYCIDRLEQDRSRFGVLSGLSFRTMTPVSLKVLVSPDPLTEDETLRQRLMLSREDLRLTRQYNMLTLDNMS